MPAIGVEYEWPFLATLGATTHTFGPKVQVIARPDEMRAGSPAERGFAEPRIRRHDPVQVGQVRRLRSPGGRHARQSRLPLPRPFPERRLDRRPCRPLLPARRPELLRSAGPRPDRHRLRTGNARLRLCIPRHREHRPRPRLHRTRPLRQQRPEVEPRRDLRRRRLSGRAALRSITLTCAKAPPPAFSRGARSFRPPHRSDSSTNGRCRARSSSICATRAASPTASGLAYAGDCFSASATYSETTDPYSDLVSTPGRSSSA